MYWDDVCGTYYRIRSGNSPFALQVKKIAHVSHISMSLVVTDCVIG
jgi:hypothetical protein